ncbi:MAG: hypothetical protein RL572_253, partial [Pseudomonadota bacterium]
VNDAPGMGFVFWDDYSTTPYDPTDSAIAGNPVAYLMSGGAQPGDPDNNAITRFKISITSGLDSENDTLEITPGFINGDIPTLSIADKFTITVFDPDAESNLVEPGQLLIESKPGLSISNSDWSTVLQLVALRSQPGAAAGDRMFAIELTDAPGGSLAPMTTVVTSFAGSPFVVTVAASVASAESEEPVAGISAAGAGTTALFTSGGGIASAVMQGDWGDDPGSFWIDQWDAASSAMADDSACPAVPADTPDPLAYWQLAESFTLLP